MEGGLKESEESCRITILLHSAHPPRSSLSVSLYNLKTQTVTPTLPSPKPTLQQRARQPNEKKKAKGNSFACVSGRPVCGCSSPVEHFTLLLLLKRQIIVTYFSYYYGCGLLLCSFRLYSIFLSHFKPFPSSFFIDEHDSYLCFLLPVAVFSARLKAACVKRTSTAT